MIRRSAVRSSRARGRSIRGATAIRNRATLGGNLMTASPAADTPPVLVALTPSPHSSARTGGEVPRDPSSPATGRPPGAAISFSPGSGSPIPAEGPCRPSIRLPRRAQSIAKVSVAGCARLEKEVSCGRPPAAGSVAPTPILLDETQRHLEGKRLSRVVQRVAVSIATAEVRPIDDVRSTAAYRRAVAGRLVGRFLEGFFQ
jgi:CO/xanthine dehydrogenase FAD-binding subunit